MIKIIGKVLFLQYDHSFKSEYKGFKSTKDLYTSYFKEKSIEVDFFDYVDLYKLDKLYYIKNVDILSYDYIFFGFISANSEMAHIILEYTKDIPRTIYGNFKEFDNKSYELELFHKYDINHIPTIICSKLTKTIRAEIEKMEYPLVVKPMAGTRGIGVVKILDYKKLKNKFLLNTSPFLVQKCIENDGDFRVLVFNGKIVMVSKRTSSKEGEFRNNISVGGTASIGEISDDIKEKIEFMSTKLMSNIIGVDIIIDKNTGKYYFMEMNSGPHYISFCDVCGVDFPMIITDFISNKIKSVI